MHYYIDGYNLIFRFDRSETELRVLREQLITELSRHLSIVKFDVTLVFDATYRHGEHYPLSAPHLHIVFTDLGETADKYIIDQIRHAPNPRENVVITSDNKLAWQARGLHAHTESVEEFMSALKSRYHKHLQRLKHPPKLNKITNVQLKPKTPPTPDAAQSAEACFDYYLNAFERESEEKMAPPHIEEAPKKKKAKSKPEEPISDMERWLRAFGGDNS